MADKKVSTRRQSVEKIVYQRPLGKLVEIDHDISTKYYIEQESLGQRVHKIKPLEINHISDLFFDTVITGPLAGSLLKIFFQQGRWNIFRFLGRIHSVFRRLQHDGRYIRSQYFYIKRLVLKTLDRTNGQ